MTRFLTALFAIFVGLALPLHDAEAKRFGGGKSSGMQRQITPQPPASAPSKNAAAPSQNNADAAAQPGKRGWMGPIAGLAAGLGLAALASHLGFGEELANLLMIALLIMAALLLFKFLTRKRPQPAMQYAGAAAGGNVMPFQAEPAAGGSTVPQAGPAVLPPGFDAEAFTRQAKLNFLRMQAAYDAGNLDDIREFTSPEMFAEVKLQLAERGATKQQTDVTRLEAEVLECAEEGNRLRASVRFYGLVREAANAVPEAFDEVWHLTKPADGSQGWVVAGIQQLN